MRGKIITGIATVALLASTGAFAATQDYGGASQTTTGKSSMNQNYSQYNPSQGSAAADSQYNPSQGSAAAKKGPTANYQGSATGSQSGTTQR